MSPGTLIDPAWLQAFAALVALGISAWAVLRTGAAEKRTNELQAKGVAVAIYTDFFTLQAEIHGNQEALGNLKKDVKGWSGESLPPHLSNLPFLANVALPPMLDRNVDSLFLLKDVGESCLQMVATLHQYNYFVDRVTPEAVIAQDDRKVDLIEQIEQRLKDLRDVVLSCKGQLRDSEFLRPKKKARR